MASPGDASAETEGRPRVDSTVSARSQVDDDQFQLLTAALHDAPKLSAQPHGIHYQMDQTSWDGMGGGYDAMAWPQMYMDPSGMYPMMAFPGGYGMMPMMQGFPGHQSQRGRGGGKMQGRGGQAAPGRGRSQNQHNNIVAATAAIAAAAPGTYTTVMFRNIPNKYTRDMLVKQLESEPTLQGTYDFVYMPIDFKNQCNVGYAFINFRTTEACESFLGCYHKFDVGKGLSKKVAEVTPARVQGYEENVQRLRNSPVMLELTQKPEWMPLIWDENGQTVPFPEPERPLAPIKPRRKA